MKTLIYRVEDKFGKGYSGNFEYSLSSEINNFTKLGVHMCHVDEPTYMNKRPRPEDDNIFNIEEHHLFGFTSHAQIVSWFGEEQLVLGKLLGGKIVVYEVDVSFVQRGDCQAVFDNRCAKVLATYEMDYFLDDSVRESLFDFKEEVEDSLECDMEIPEGLMFLVRQERG